MKKRLLSSFLRLQKLNLGRTPNKNSPSNWFFRCKMRFREGKSSEEKKEMPRKVWFLPPKWPKWTKKGGFGVEITGRRWSGKSSFTADFAMLWSSKMGANEFFSHFFRRSLAGNGEMLYLCTRNREATLLQERVTLWKQRGSKSAAVIFESLT